MMPVRADEQRRGQRRAGGGAGGVGRRDLVDVDGRPGRRERR
jgi:hypothetical protein